MHSLPIVRTNETECQRLCSNDVTCNWFSFDQTHVVCSLYATCDTLQEDPNQAIISKMGFCDGSEAPIHFNSGFSFTFIFRPWLGTQRVYSCIGQRLGILHSQAVKEWR